MTCIVAYRDDKGTVWMGGDSGSFSGWDVGTIPGGKVARKGEFLMGYTGDGRGADLLRYSFVPPDLGGQDIDLMSYMVNQFVDALRDCLKGAGFAKTIEGKESQPDGALLVAVRGHMFLVASDYCVDEDIRRYYAIGAGAGYATGALWAALKVAPLAKQPDGEALVRLAIEAAIEHSAGVRGPITVLNDKQLVIVEDAA